MNRKLRANPSPGFLALDAGQPQPRRSSSRFARQALRAMGEAFSVDSSAAHFAYQTVSMLEQLLNSGTCLRGFLRSTNKKLTLFDTNSGGPASKIEPMTFVQKVIVSPLVALARASGSEPDPLS